MAAPIPVWSCGIKDGVLSLDARALFAGYVSRLKDGAYTLTLKRLSRRKSTNQLGYLYGVVYPVIAEELGYREYEVEEVHDAIVRELRGLKPEPNPLKLRWSLREQDHAETSRYIEDVRHHFLLHYGIVTPDAERVEEPVRKQHDERADDESQDSESAKRYEARWSDLRVRVSR